MTRSAQATDPIAPSLDERTSRARGAWGWRVRLRGAMVLGACAALLVAGWRLEPDSRGYGTAQQLDLPACSMLVNTGWPCPSCGMTTSVACTVRGRFVAAGRAQLFGIVLVAAACVVGTCGLMELACGRGVLGGLRPGVWWLVGGIGGMLAGWGVKILIGLMDGSFPIR
jgi:uncharacterized protein DUF2752